MTTVTAPILLDSTGQQILSKLNEVSIMPQIVDNLTTSDATKALSAKQGKVLNDKISSSIKVAYRYIETTFSNGTASYNYSSVLSSLGWTTIQTVLWLYSTGSVASTSPRGVVVNGTTVTFIATDTVMDGTRGLATVLIGN